MSSSSNASLSLPVLVLAFAGSGVATVFAVNALGSDQAEATVSSPDPVAVARLDRIERRLVELAERSTAPAPMSTGMAERAEVPEALVRRVVEEVLAEQNKGVAEASAQPAESMASISGIIAKLDEVGSFGPAGDRIWDQLKAEGRLDEVIEALRLRAEQQDTADASAQYGDALIAKLRRADNQIEVSRLAMQADSAYDDALDINPEHWGARFSKAVSYTFWPAITGKPASALQHFETLIDQQNSKPKQPEFAMTYVMLGNLHMQRGDADKARDIWSQGILQFPDNTELRQQLGR